MDDNERNIRDLLQEAKAIRRELEKMNNNLRYIEQLKTTAEEIKRILQQKR